MNNKIQDLNVSANWLIIGYNKKNNSPSHSYHRTGVSPPLYVEKTYSLLRHNIKIFCNELSELPGGILRLYGFGFSNINCVLFTERYVVKH